MCIFTGKWNIGMMEDWNNGWFPGCLQLSCGHIFFQIPKGFNMNNPVRSAGLITIILSATLKGLNNSTFNPFRVEHYCSIFDHRFHRWLFILKPFGLFILKKPDSEQSNI
jgi:hypothetical protein